MGRLKTCIYVKERRMNGGRTLETGNEACEFHIKKKNEEERNKQYKKKYGVREKERKRESENTCI